MVEQALLGCSAMDGGNRQSWPLVAEFLDYLRKAGIAEGYLQEFHGPAKHLLVWLDRNDIGFDARDRDLVWPAARSRVVTKISTGIARAGS